MHPPDHAIGAPREPLGRLFLRFLRFGLLAFGGPVAQIAMIRRELVDDERWISSERFNRTLAVYQVLPGPEAHELCVYFGYLSRGRLGGVLAGLGFMLPGFVGVLVLAWAYVRYGITAGALAGAFYGFQAAVAALIVRAVHRIGRHALVDPWLWAIAAAVAAAQALEASFAVTLPFAGLAYAAVARRRFAVAAAVTVAFAVAVAVVILSEPGTAGGASTAVLTRGGLRAAGLGTLAISGLRAGLLTFGGAYTAIPFLQRDAVVTGRWMTNDQFLDGLALSGVLPAPLIIFGTFVGYIGGGFPGAIVVTAGIFLPAFSFTLVGHRRLERLVENTNAHAFLDGVAAGVVGLIAVTAVRLVPAAIPDVAAGALFALALAALYRWQAKWTIGVVVLAAGALGLAIR